MMLKALKNHWQEYASEAVGLGAFMISACFFTVLLFHPAMRIRFLNDDSLRVLMGSAMGATAVLIFISPFGKRSGAHINPAVTLAFLRLGKIKMTDAFFYILFQFAGASLGVLIAFLLLGNPIAAPEVNFAATTPAMNRPETAFAAEFLISFLMMITVLATSNHGKLSRYTPYLAALLVIIYIALESPVSGMSMNPARTFGSAIFANVWQAWWIYFTAPPLGMLLAAEIFVRTKGVHRVLCAKLNHDGKARCIFNCNYKSEPPAEAGG